MDIKGDAFTTAEIAAMGLVGYTHFTSMLVQAGAVRGLSLHLERLSRDCRRVFDTELDTDRVRELARAALPEDGEPIVMRITVGDPDLQLARPGASARPRIMITSRPAPPAVQAPLRLQSTIYRRDMAAIKHGGLFGQEFHRASAQRGGFDDVLFAEPDGTISEACTSNIAVLDGDGRVIWPDAEVLLGTTMQLINRSRDAAVVTEKVTLAGLDQYAAVVATNAAVGVRPVAVVDDMVLPVDLDVIAAVRADYESVPPQTI